MPAPTDPGTLTYNGISFSSLYKSKITGKPIPDSANRTNVGVLWTVDVEGYINAGSGGTDSTLAGMRQGLTAYGGRLEYSSKGFGDLKIDASPVDDAAYGPRPTLFSFVPVGASQTALVHWTCETLIPECPGAAYTMRIMEFCYDISWDVDSDGYTTRTVTGHVVVPAARRGPRDPTIPDNADRLRDQVVPDTPLGFQRTQKFKLSEDKRRLDFTVVDTQMAAALPSGASNASMRHRVSWKRRPNAAYVRGSIGGTITPPADQPRSTAWDIFYGIANSRLAVLRNAVGGAGNQGDTFMIDGLDVDEDMFGRSSDFNMQYLIVSTKALQNILTDSGLWKPIQGATFQSWKGSMANGPQNVRGQAGMQFQNSDDSIFSLCDPGTPPKIGSNAQLASPGSGVSPSSPVVPSTPPPPPPNASWIAFENVLTVVEDDRVARHKPLAQVPGEANAQIAPTGGKLASDQGGINACVQTTQPDKLQRVNSASFRVRMSGSALRLNYDIPLPALQSFQGQQTTQVDCIQSTSVYENVGGMKIIWGAWDITYSIPGSWQGSPPDYDNPALS